MKTLSVTIREPHGEETYYLELAEGSSIIVPTIGRNSDGAIIATPSHREVPVDEVAAISLNT
jgi:hypothetical protein